nr:MAG TPA: hypothetical protein [Caudoviricetes sp.]
MLEEKREVGERLPGTSDEHLTGINTANGYF